MKLLRRIWYKLFPAYRRVELKVCTWNEADLLIKQNAVFKELDQHWHIAKEDEGMTFPFVAIERRERITE